ncbi:pyrimidine pathway regulatory protein 1 [Cladorrhinum sp. PSN332]|nr:pyrimidine pathway regulatory protein 1 [Cladorrhinum sp. PSN332]
MAARRAKSTCSTGSQPRQLPGPACEGCRKRKLRCDRQRPACATCAESGIECDINTNRLARGPKKGDLKALRNRVVALERRLSLEQMQAQLPEEWATASEQSDAQAALDLSPLSTTPNAGFFHYPSPSQSSPPSWNDEIQVQVTPMTPTTSLEAFAFPTFAFPHAPESPPKSSLVDDLMQADLDQIYFDRVHPNIPLFNQSRYFSRSRQPSVTTGPNYMLCLQYAMWTLATAFSSQFEELGRLLYKETRDMLEAFDMSEQDLGVVPMEQVQAWLLLAFFESARCNNRRAWTTAGRAFRLVQLSRLHEVDTPENQAEFEDPVLVEERRRTFWIAYSLDRLICIRNCCPLTFAEETIYTRLPSHEISFQSGQPIPSCFLSEAIASADHTVLPPLAESAILANVCGRALSHARSSRVDRAYSAASVEFWARHNWVESMLTRIVDGLNTNSPVTAVLTDPMILFTLMMAHSTTIYMCQVVESLGMESQYQLTVMEYQARSMNAAREIARHTKAHEHMGYFKAHMFLPWAISLAASNFLRNSSQVIETESQFVLNGGLFSCMGALRKMQSFNSLAREHLSVLESQDLGLIGL